MYNMRLRQRNEEDQMCRKRFMKGTETQIKTRKVLQPQGDENRCIEVFRKENTNMRLGTPIPNNTVSRNKLNDGQQIMKHQLPITTANPVEPAKTPIISKRRRMLSRSPPTNIETARDEPKQEAKSQNRDAFNLFPTSSPINSSNRKPFELSVELSRIDNQSGTVTSRLSCEPKLSTVSDPVTPSSEQKDAVHKNSNRILALEEPDPTNLPCENVNKALQKFTIQPADLINKQQDQTLVPIATPKIDVANAQQLPQIQSEIENASSHVQILGEFGGNPGTSKQLTDPIIPKKDHENGEKSSVEEIHPPMLKPILDDAREPSPMQVEMTPAAIHLREMKSIPVCPIVLHQFIGHHPARVTMRRKRKVAPTIGNEIL